MTNHPPAPPRCLCITHTQLPAHTGMGSGRSHRHARTRLSRVDSAYPGARPAWGGQTARFLCPSHQIEVPLMRGLPSSPFLNPCAPLSEMPSRPGSSHLNLRPSARFVGVSIKNCPEMCFSSALNVFPIRSRCAEPKERFSGLDEMT